MVDVIPAGAACTLDGDYVVSQLQVDPSRGLSAYEVFERQKKFGLNELHGRAPDPLWRKFFDKLKDPMIALLLGSAFVSMFMQQFDDAISITLVRFHSIIEFPTERHRQPYMYSFFPCRL